MSAVRRAVTTVVRSAGATTAASDSFSCVLMGSRRPFAVTGPPATSRAVATSLSVRRWFSSENGSAEKPSGEEGAAKEAGSPGSVSIEEQLKAKVNELQEEVKELKGERLRLLAEMENVRQIARRDVESTKNYAIQSFAKQLLDVADTLGLAIDSVPADALSHENADKLRTLHEGVSMTRGHLLKLFGQHGLKQFGEVGEKFDANKHEVMFEVHHDELDHGHVAHVIKPGFFLKDRVLRPAKVGTVRKASKPAEPAN